MNVSMVVLGHLTNPHDLKGSFSVHFGAEDFAGHGASAKASARTFNLSVHVGSAKPSAVHFFLVRTADGVRVEHSIECLPERRNYAFIHGKFASPEAGGTVGQFDAALHWDGLVGILTAYWTVPRR